MRNFTSFLRVTSIVALAALVAEFFLGSWEKTAIITYPEIPVFLVFLTIVLIIVEIMLGSLKTLAEAIMTEEQRQKHKEAAKNAWYRRFYAKMLDQKPIEKESEIILDHDYDGIKELDNTLPPWWVYMFYLTIIFAGIYMVRYHILGADNQKTEYEKAVAEAQLQIEEYKRNAPDLLNADNVELLTDAADISAGKVAFETNCVACHMADGGGGIGPNLTDDYWILGGGIKEIFTTISEGGREGKGMVPWKSTLKPREIAQVASYIKSLRGKTPANPKEPEGDLWVEQTTSQDTQEQEVSL
ncbi:cbb3-type cytochrome c oxidase N-terminal domain-containing protein [Capnocytophaga canimorsus]|uniref:cbb3-type cytochrome c oxidase N-terminal domain-containing protein n=1 Tax=Capnocytophaga canimorsus TaxID=28188 RepID=UPI0037D752A5